MNQFGKLYARYYDLMYTDKDYNTEVDYILNLLPETFKAKTLLDIGCGTGKHSELFVNKGLNVHGIDLSDEMLEIANQRANKYPTQLSFSHGNAQSFKLDKKFDIIVSLFHVMSYQTKNEEIINAFKSVKNHLFPGGYFIFDFWYGPGVLSDPPAVRVKRLQDHSLAVTRIAEPVMYADKNVVDVNYEINLRDINTNESVDKFETHSMRYFFDPELELMLSQLGFKIEKKYEWLKDLKPNFDSWNVVWIVKG